MKFKQPLVEDLLRAIKAMKKLQSVDEVSLLFPKLVYKDVLLCVMSDAAFGNLVDGVSSGGGHVIFLADNSSRCALLAWKANKIRRVVRSTMAAEALALEECLEHAIYLRSLLKEMTGGLIDPRIEAWTDNRDTYAAVYSTKLISDLKLRIDLACIKENVEKERVILKHCTGDKMLANPLTKRGANSDDLLRVMARGSF